MPSVAAATGDFDVQAFLEQQPGVLKTYREGQNRASEIIEGYATYYSLNPRILLALLELVPHLLSEPSPPPELLIRPFGDRGPAGFVAQIDWAAREIRAGLGPYTSPPDVRFSDGKRVVLDLDQDPSEIAVQRFLAQGRTELQWTTLKDQYQPLFVRLFGVEPEAATPTPRPVAGRPFLRVPWPAIYPAVAGDPLSGKPVRMIHSSYFDHVYPTVDKGEDGNDFIVTYENRGAVSYNTHDGHDYYFPDRPIGTPIVAAAPGIAYAFTARGNGVVIRHQGAYAGYETVYWHLNAFDQKFRGRIDTGVGVAVRAGDYLGTSGKSGFVVGGAHLHFEVRHNGRQVDPYGWFGPGSDPCAAWVAGCEASVWLWHDSLRGTYDFTAPNADAPVIDDEPPIGTLTVQADPDLRLLVHFDDHPVQDIGMGAPMFSGPKGANVLYEDGVFGKGARVPANLSLTYPISGNVDLDNGSLIFWAKIPDKYPNGGTGRQYLVAASNNPGDSAHGVYTDTLALRRETVDDQARWNFWTVDDRGERQDLVVTDTLEAGWHHFAMVWDQPPDSPDTAKRLYIDGRLAAEQTNATFPTFVGDRLEIGRWTPRYGVSGVWMDELASFSRALSPTEVERLFNRQDYATSEPGPLGADSVVGRQAVVLDTNAIDRQGGIVAVRLRRDSEPWGQPLAYYDSYHWQITGTEGLHTFAVEYRDRANNVSVVTTTLSLGTIPLGRVEMEQSSGAEASDHSEAIDLFERSLDIVDPTVTISATSRLQLQPLGEAPASFQISQRTDFDGAEWRPFVATLDWTWAAGQPQIAYVRFRSREGLIGPVMLVGNDLKHQYLSLVSRGS